MENKLKAVFDRIRAEASLKRDTKAAVLRKLSKRNSVVTLRAIAAGTCCTAILLSCFWSYQRPTATISLDAGHSLELGINCFDRVISVEAFNEDGQELLNRIQVMNLGYTEAVKQLLEQGSTSEEELTVVSVSGTEGNQVDRIILQMENCGGENQQAQCQYADPEIVEQAHANGVSAGKYRAFQELQTLDPSVTLEEVMNMTMKQIRQRIEELHSGDTDATKPEIPEEDESQGNGPGYGKEEGQGNGYHGGRGQEKE